MDHLRQTPMTSTKPRTSRTTVAPRPTKATRTITAPYDAADYLKTEGDMVGLLVAALEDGHPQVIAAAVGAIARAQGMTKLANEVRPEKVRSDFTRRSPARWEFAEADSRLQ